MHSVSGVSSSAIDASADVIVVGLGAIGSATAYQLARRGFVSLSVGTGGSMIYTSLSTDQVSKVRQELAVSD